jgi:hypothetical protein
MFEEFMGIPAHPLLVHSAVVFGPLLILAVFVYGLVPVVRSRMGWALAALAVVAPIALWFARLSGEAFEERMRSRNPELPAEFLDVIHTHSEFGETASLWGTLLGLLALGLIYVCWSAARRPVSSGSTALQYVLIGASLVVAVVLGYYVYRTGDTGAKAVWTGQ